MKKVFAVVITLAMVLGICGPSFGNDEDKEVGRFQVVNLQSIQTHPLFILVDTAKDKKLLFRSG